MNIKYISDTFLDWYTFYEDNSLLNEKKFYRAYEIWNHCKNLLDSENSELIRIDVISNLKRCLNQRLKILESNYYINNIPLFKSKKKYLENLESLGLVRPFMLKQLLEIRNDIEHNDAKPPGLKRTYELLDVVWYFLKSTDSLVKWLKNDMIYEYTDRDIGGRYWLQLNIDHSHNWELKIRGWIPKEFIKDKYSKRYLEVSVIDLHPKSKTKFPSSHKDKLNTDLFLSGVLKPDDIRLRKILSYYFQL